MDTPGTGADVATCRCECDREPAANPLARRPRSAWSSRPTTNAPEVTHAGSGRPVEQIVPSRAPTMVGLYSGHPVQIDASVTKLGDPARRAAKRRDGRLNVLSYLTAHLDACGRNGGKPLSGPDLECFLPWNASPGDLQAWAKPPSNPANPPTRQTPRCRPREPATPACPVPAIMSFRRRTSSGLLPRPGPVVSGSIPRA